MIIILFKVVLTLSFISRFVEDFLIAVLADPERFVEMRIERMLERDVEALPVRLSSLCMAGIWGGALWLLWA